MESKLMVATVRKSLRRTQWMRPEGHGLQAQWAWRSGAVKRLKLSDHVFQARDKPDAWDGKRQSRTCILPKSDRRFATHAKQTAHVCTYTH